MPLATGAAVARHRRIEQREVRRIGHAHICSAGSSGVSRRFGSRRGCGHRSMFREMPEFIRRSYDRRRSECARRARALFRQNIDDGRITSGSEPPSKLPTTRRCICARCLCVGLLAARCGDARYGRTLFDKRMMPASLDHAMWFHPRSCRQWLLMPRTHERAGGRGLTRGMIFSRTARWWLRWRRKAHCANAAIITRWRSAFFSTSTNCDTNQRVYQAQHPW